MEVYTSNTRDTNLLSQEHKRTLEESAIAPEIAAARGYWTAKTGKEVPQEHGYLPRKPGMVVPVHPLDGSEFARLREDEPDTGAKYKQPAGMGSRLDIHPFQHERIRQPGGIRFVTEGEKKTDSGVTIDELMVGLAGVYNGQKNGELIDDWKLLPLQGEHYAICFDAPDMTENPQVQAAADLMARLLQAEGAVVSVVWLPTGPNGEKQGLDDFLANGGTKRELEMLTRPYDPADFARVRMTRNEKLREGYRALLAEWFSYDWQHFVGKPKLDRETGEIKERPNWQRGHSARETKLALITLVPERGKIKGDTVEVQAGVRTIADRSPLSREPTSKALLNLQADGQLEIIEPDSKEKARTYRLKLPARRSDSMEREATGGRESKEVFHRVSEVRAPSVSRLRWSSPPGRLRKEFETVEGRGVVRATGAKPRDEQRPAPAIKRLGPHRGAVVDTLERVEGETMHIESLMDALNYTGRKRDFRARRLKDLIKSGVVELEGDEVRLSREWRESLDARRECDGEIEQAEHQAKKHKDEQKEYREHRERKKHGTPEASMDAARRTKEMREKRLREIEEEKRRDQDPPPPEVAAFVRRILRNHDRMRLGLLCEVGREKGLRWRDIPPAVERMGYRVEKLPEYQNAAFIFTDRGVA